MHKPKEEGTYDQAENELSAISNLYWASVLVDYIQNSMERLEQCENRSIKKVACPHSEP